MLRSLFPRYLSLTIERVFELFYCKFTTIYNYELTNIQDIIWDNIGDNISNLFSEFLQELLSTLSTGPLFKPDCLPPHVEKDGETGNFERTVELS